MPLLPLLLLWAAARAADARQAPAPGAAEPLVTESFALRHQSVAEAAGLVYPLLSERGTVEVRPRADSLVIRDVRATVDRILELLADFDQPAQALALEIRVVSAQPRSGSEEAPSGLPEELVKRLRELLRYESYRLVAEAELATAEGREVRRALGGGYLVDFRVGRLDADRRIRLNGFRILRGAAAEDAKPLIHTNLNLRLDRPMVLGLARTESSDRALMVVLSCALAPAGGRPAEER